jgi:hypothetical protein
MLAGVLAALAALARLQGAVVAAPVGLTRPFATDIASICAQGWVLSSAMFAGRYVP